MWNHERQETVITYVHNALRVANGKLIRQLHFDFGRDVYDGSAVSLHTLQRRQQAALRLEERSFLHHAIRLRSTQSHPSRWCARK
jgi:hypothetical protein